MLWLWVKLCVCITRAGDSSGRRRRLLGLLRGDVSVDVGKPLPHIQVKAYNDALQPVSVNAPAVDQPRLDRMFANAAQRCALVQPTFCAIAGDESYYELAMAVRENGALDNQMEGGDNGPAAVERTTPCLRRTPATTSLDEAEVLLVTKRRVLTG